MLVDYADIISRAGQPDWYDQNGTPRYGDITPNKVTVYGKVVIAYKIACQACGEEFIVVEPFSEYHICSSGVLDTPLPQPGEDPPYYGDPPRHECSGGGDTMTCDNLYVIHYWQSTTDDGWQEVQVGP